MSEDHPERIANLELKIRSAKLQADMLLARAEKTANNALRMQLLGMANALNDSVKALQDGIELLKRTQP